MSTTCAACFTDEASPIALTASRSSKGTCDFCGSGYGEVWPAETWAPLFEAVIQAYEPTDRHDAGAKSLQVRLQEDWRIFRFDDDASGSQVLRFLKATFASSLTFLNEYAYIKPLDEPGHTQEWDSFVREVTESNRYFPKAALDLPFLEKIIRDNVQRIQPDTPLYRARIHPEQTALAPEEMGKPPTHMARQGRANAVGISHLYLSTAERTCIHECRPAPYSYVTVATFRVVDTCEVLVLNGIKRQNPFMSLDDPLGKRLDYWKLLERLGRELSRPARTTDNQIEYISTQYLSDFVKSLDLHGIEYASSLYPKGSNVVLFNDDIVDVESDVRCYEVTGINLDYVES